MRSYFRTDARAPSRRRFENRAGGRIRFGGEHLANGSSVHAGQYVAVLDGVGEDSTDLIDGRNLAFGVFVAGRC